MIVCSETTNGGTVMKNMHGYPYVVVRHGIRGLPAVT